MFVVSFVLFDAVKLIHLSFLIDISHTILLSELPIFVELTKSYDRHSDHFLFLNNFLLKSALSHRYHDTSIHILKFSLDPDAVQRNRSTVRAHRLCLYCAINLPAILPQYVDRSRSHTALIIP